MKIKIGATYCGMQKDFHLQTARKVLAVINGSKPRVVYFDLFSRTRRTVSLKSFEAWRERRRRYNRKHPDPKPEHEHLGGRSQLGSQFMHVFTAGF